MRQLDVSYYLELQRRIEEVFLYVACHDINFGTYSIKIENLFVDICAFFDSLCQTTIVEKNNLGQIFSNTSSVRNFSDKIAGREYFNMGDYRILLEAAFSFSNLELRLNVHEDSLDGTLMGHFTEKTNGFMIKPFENWNSGSLSWWNSFTKLKHNRLANIKEATLERTIQSLGATYVVLTIKNEPWFKGGSASMELYQVFRPMYWKHAGSILASVPRWK